MNQQGYIIEIVDDKTAKLKMQRHSACASCGKCATTSSETKDILVEVDNAIGARIGDHVEVNMEDMKLLKATAIAYLIPLIALLTGTIGTYFILGVVGIEKNIEIISGIVGLSFTLLSFLIIKKNDNKLRESRDYIPVITKILTS